MLAIFFLFSILCSEQKRLLSTHVHIYNKINEMHINPVEKNKHIKYLLISQKNEDMKTEYFSFIENNLFPLFLHIPNKI